MMTGALAPIPILTGPTGSGKSEWAIRAARELPLEIVSVDSALVYRGLDIGTAKPGADVRATIAHHLIDIRDPSQAYSAGEFVADAQRLIGEIRSRDRVPLLVGGTMLYLRVLRAGLATLPLARPALRRELDARAASEGWPALHAELARVDPQAAARIHPNDAQRIQRALEVQRATGLPMSALQTESTRAAAAGTFIVWALTPPREALQERLENRFRAMMSRGFLDEVQRLRSRGDLTIDHPAVRSVGYRQLWRHLDGATTLEEAVQQGIAATRQLSKRQLTWLRADNAARRMNPFGDKAYEKWLEELAATVTEHGPGAAGRGSI